MPDEYIKRSSASRALCDNCEDQAICTGICAETLRINQIPAEDVALVKHGKWEKARNREALSYADVYAECSVCHGEPVFAGRMYRFCPRCGAEMDKEGE